MLGWIRSALALRCERTASPALFAAFTGGRVFRMGMWPGVRPPRWPKFPEITREVEAASDGAAIFADLDI